MTFFRTVVLACLLVLGCADSSRAGAQDDWKPLPAKFYAGVPFVEVRLGDATGWFALDTGSGKWYFDETWAKARGLSVVREKGSGSDTPGKSVVSSTVLRIGDLEVTAKDAECIHFADGLDGYAGLVGPDFFTDRPVRVRYSEEAVDYLATGSPAIPAQSTIVPLFVWSSPFCPVLLGREGRPPRSVYAVIDTGCEFSLVLSPKTAAALDVSRVPDSKRNYPILGEERAYETTAPLTMALAGKRLPRCSAEIESGHVWNDNVEALIGSGFLSGYDVILDFPRRIMVLSPPGGATRARDKVTPRGPEDPGLSRLPAAKSDLLLTLPAGPATERASLSLGDVLLSVNGRDVTKSSVDEVCTAINEQMRSNHHVTLRVRRGDAYLEITLNELNEPDKAGP